MPDSKIKDYERFSVSVPSDLNKDFEKLRSNLNMSRSDAIRKSMRLFLKMKRLESAKSGKNKEMSVLGIITYIEKAHIHSHEIEKKDKKKKEKRKKKDNSKKEEKKEKKEKKDYYYSVDELEFIKINNIQHHFIKEIISTTHIHTELNKCMIIISVHGPYNRVQKLLDELSRFKTILSLEFTPLEFD